VKTKRYKKQRKVPAEVKIEGKNPTLQGKKMEKTLKKTLEF